MENKNPNIHKGIARAEKLKSNLHTIQLILLFLFLLSPYVWVWMGWSLFWKIALSIFLATIPLYIILSGVQAALVSAKIQLAKISKETTKTDI